jgi:hypothetical protein
MRRRTLVIGSVVLSGAALVLFCCGGSQPDANAPSNDPVVTADVGSQDGPATGASAERSNAALPEANPVPPAASGAVAPAAAPSATAPDSTATGAGARIAKAVAASDPRDLKLLAGIERELKLDPPPEVHALIAARQRGAGREELVRGILALSDVRVRALAFRWLDEVAKR